MSTSVCSTTAYAAQQKDFIHFIICYLIGNQVQFHYKIAIFICLWKYAVNLGSTYEILLYIVIVGKTTFQPQILARRCDVIL